MLAAQKHSVTHARLRRRKLSPGSFPEEHWTHTEFVSKKPLLSAFDLATGSSVKSIPAQLQTRSEMNAPANAKRRHNPLFNTTTPFHVLNVRHQRNEDNNGQERLLFQQAGTSGVYYPETLKSMRLAFDLAWNHVSSIFEDPEAARQILAVQILHHTDRGEHGVGGLATAATTGLFAAAGVCDCHYPSTGPQAKKNVNRDFAHFRTLRQI